MRRPGRKLRLLVAAFGDPGHSFPAIALARALRGRGHEVLVETWERWREPVEAEGLRFTAAEEYKAFPPPEPGSDGWRSAADAAIALAPLMDDFRPDVVVSDILTLAPALAAERAGVPVLCCPHVGDMAENSARVAWAGTGLMLPWRLLGSASLRWSTRRILRDRSFAQQAQEISMWSRGIDGAGHGASLVEEHAS